MSSPASLSLFAGRESRLHNRHGEGSLTLRPARPADAESIDDLAAMEEVVLHAPVMVAVRASEAVARPLAETDQVVAALSLADGTVAADPFVRTADAVALLRMRARQERRHSARSRRRFRMRAGLVAG
jgi:hypothetical protein